MNLMNDLHLDKNIIIILFIINMLIFFKMNLLRLLILGKLSSDALFVN
jgi:hypothetical protein